MLPERSKEMRISKELLDALLKGCERPEDLLGNVGLTARRAPMLSVQPARSSSSLLQSASNIGNHHRQEIAHKFDKIQYLDVNI
jgi:hypothetical protein